MTAIRIKARPTLLRPSPGRKYGRRILAPFVAAVSAVGLVLGGYQPSPLLPLDGAYRFPDGNVHSLAVSGDSLLWTDLRTGELRELAAGAAGRFTFGPAYQVQSPVRGTVETGPGSLTLTRNGSPAASATLLPVRREAVVFRNGRVTLHGKVTAPAAEGRRPGVVLIHGSEPGDRDEADLYVNLYISLGFAVLSYDKRGVGDSTGLYVEQATAQNIGNLAGDARAALRLLAARPDVDPARVGFSGGSQAGWVIARAAAAAPLAHFAVVLSGPAMSSGEQGAYQGLTGGGTVVPPPTAKRIRTTLETVSPSGYDPRRDLRRLRIPMLWLFGAQDKSVYAPQSVGILRSLHKPAFAIRVFPGAGHFLLNTPRGLTREVPRATRFMPVFPAIRAWLAARHIVP